jgi:DNA-binding IclR family transcriptional regulator
VELTLKIMIQVINRSVDILEYVAEDIYRPKLLGNIAKDLNLNVATCANIVKTLIDRGLLKKKQSIKGYLIGDRLLEICNGTVGYKDLLIKANPVFENVLKEINENCLIAILKNDTRLVIDKKNCSHLVQATTPDEKLAYDSSTGRLLIAFLTDHDLQLYLKKYGLPPKEVWSKAASRIGFFEQINIIRKQGFALIEDTVQIVGIAVPIYQNKKVIASFSIYLPAFRFNDKMRDKMINKAVLTAKILSGETQN